jgi:2'-5' RNA ligase
MIRLFAAVPIPQEIGEGLVRRQQGIPRAKWRTTEQMHITLRFFGDVPESTAADIDGELSAVSGPPMELNLEGAGAFGEGHTMRALWAGVCDSPELRRLAGRCEAAARRAGLKPEPRAYKPHVTLAYLKRADPGRVGAWIQGHNLLRSPGFRVDRFGLYSSWSLATGNSYELEREYPLLG